MKKEMHHEKNYINANSRFGGLAFNDVGLRLGTRPGKRQRIRTLRECKPGKIKPD
jgi:hypothetical protein